MTRALRGWKIFAGTVAMGVLIGCRSAPARPPRVTEIPVPAPVAPLPTNRAPEATLVPPRSASPPTPTNTLADEWISWNRWCATNGLSGPQQGTAAKSQQYALHTPRGTLAVTLGSRLASWEGVEVWLGFPPQFIDDQPYVHHLDAQKNFQPLLATTNALPATKTIIVIDPGHGGENTGARSVLGSHYEKEYTLDWARRLQSLLATNGWTVFLTRTNDADVSLSNRVALAEQAKAGLFLSLHFNSAFPNEKQSGLETYCLTPVGMPSSLTRDFSDDPRLVFPNNAFDDQNLRLAACLHRALVATTTEADRGVRRARFMGVLRGQNRPAVLIEGGYLSNPHDARLIASGNYRQTLADAVARALEEQAGLNVAATGKSAPAAADGR